MIASSLAGSASGAEGVVLSWEDAAAEAAAKNPALASSRLSADASRASYYASFNSFMPRLGLSNSASESNTARKPAWSAAASASLTLFDMGEAASIRSASASLSAAEANLRRASAELRASLRRAFSSLLSSEAALASARLVLELRRHNAELVTLRYDSGRESKGNMLRAKAQSLAAHAQLATAVRDLRAAQREMASQLGREGFEAFTATGTFSSSPPPPRPEDFRSLLPLRTELAASEAALRSARAALAQSRSALWPSLSADYTRTRSGPSEFPGSRYAWSAGATLSYPIFGRGPTATYHSTLASKRSAEAARADLQSARRQALSDLESAWAGYASAADQVLVQDALLAAARQRNDEADVRYASGLLSFDNWEVIVTDRVSAERQAVSARRSAMDAETAWDRALGRALGE